MNSIKNKLGYIMVGLGLTASAFAVDPTISDAQTAVSTGITTIGTVAGGVAAVAAGVLVFRAVRKYFSKAS